MGRRAQAKKVSPREAQELENYKAVRSLLESLGWQVNLARTLGGHGGHCVVHGQQRVILKSQAPTSDKVDILVDALRREDLSEVEVPALVQALLDAVPQPDDGGDPAQEQGSETAASTEEGATDESDAA